MSDEKVLEPLLPLVVIIMIEIMMRRIIMKITMMMTAPKVWLMTMLMMTMISGPRGPHHPCSSLFDRDDLLSGKVHFVIYQES